MKRFIDTRLHRKPWFQALSPELREVFRIAFCECDFVGIYEVNIPEMEFWIGGQLPPQPELVTAFGGRIIAFDDGRKWFIPGFVKFQYGELSSKSRVHQAVVKRLNGLKDKVTLPIPYLQAIDTLSIATPKPINRLKEKDKDKDKEKEKRGCKGGKEKTKDPKLLSDRAEAKAAFRGLFNRRESTKWTEAETRALGKILPIPREDFELVANLYQNGFPYRRRKMQTLLNNWPGEVDVARSNKENPITPSAEGWNASTLLKRIKEISNSIEDLTHPGGCADRVALDEVGQRRLESLKIEKGKLRIKLQGMA